MAEVGALRIRVDSRAMKKAIEAALRPTEILALLFKVGDTLSEAEAKHGTQEDLPLGFGPHKAYLEDILDQLPFGLTNEVFEETARKLVERKPTWANILLEEVAELLAADTREEAHAEALQVAAMALKIAYLTRPA